MISNLGFRASAFFRHSCFVIRSLLFYLSPLSLAQTSFEFRHSSFRTNTGRQPLPIGKNSEKTRSEKLRIPREKQGSDL
jgi:hypothetical protein